ncbi:MAG TPA: PKD domain-containing protein [Aeromicrobium sp.]|nr:PKD domain-containing protein [Aeromicrobium sp.]
MGIPPLTVTFYNTSTGGSPTGCLWTFGDSTVSSSCGNQVTKSYTTRGTYTVSLTIDGQMVSRASYVLVGCKVPAFAGVHVSNVQTNWTNAGFSASNLSYLDGQGNGNYKIGYQSLAGGLVNPSGGCSGATVTVGP